MFDIFYIKYFWNAYYKNLPHKHIIFIITIKYIYKLLNIENKSIEITKIANLKSRLARNSFSKIRRKNIFNLEEIVLPKLNIIKSTEESDKNNSDDEDSVLRTNGSSSKWD